MTIDDSKRSGKKLKSLAKQWLLRSDLSTLPFDDVVEISSSESELCGSDDSLADVSTSPK